MNAHRIKLERHYRLGYQESADGVKHNAYSRYVSSRVGADTLLAQLEQCRRDYSALIFWIEEFNPINSTWFKISNNSMYELFSEDEPEEEKPAKKKSAAPEIWRFIPDTDTDTDVPF